jgi:hypothetical protein
MAQKRLRSPTFEALNRAAGSDMWAQSLKVFAIMKKKSLVQGLVLACAVVSSGCVAAAVGGAAAGGAGGVAYVEGKLDSKEPAPVPVVQRATLEALNELKLPVDSQRGDSSSGRVESSYSDGKRLTVDLDAKGSSVTEVAIRVGTFGDQSRSQQLLDTIRRHLPGSAHQA